MSIELKPETQEMIKHHVGTGIYTDADDVIMSENEDEIAS